MNFTQKEKGRALQNCRARPAAFNCISYMIDILTIGGGRRAEPFPHIPIIACTEPKPTASAICITFIAPSASSALLRSNRTSAMVPAMLMPVQR